MSEDEEFGPNLARLLQLHGINVVLGNGGIGFSHISIGEGAKNTLENTKLGIARQDQISSFLNNVE